MSLSFAPSGHTLTGDSEGSIYVWSPPLATIEIVGAITGAPKEAVFALTSTPDGFVSGSRDGVLKIWSWDYTPFPVHEGERNEMNLGEGIRCIAPFVTAEGPSLSQFTIGTVSNGLLVVDALHGNVTPLFAGHHGTKLKCVYIGTQLSQVNFGVLPPTPRAAPYSQQETTRYSVHGMRLHTDWWVT